MRYTLIEVLGALGLVVFATAVTVAVLWILHKIIGWILGLGGGEP